MINKNKEEYTLIKMEDLIGKKKLSKSVLKQLESKNIKFDIFTAERLRDAVQEELQTIINISNNKNWEGTQSKGLTQILNILLYFEDYIHFVFNGDYDFEFGIEVKDKIKNLVKQIDLEKNK